jgi:hypothetical protein
MTADRPIPEPASDRPARARPRDVARGWVDAFDRAAPSALAALHHAEATNDRITKAPVHGLPIPNF